MRGLALISICLFTQMAIATPSIHIRELSVVKATQKNLTLADIADIQGFRKDDLRKLQHISIGNAPHESESREFTSFALSEVLRAHLAAFESHYSKQVDLSIPRKVRVEGDSQYLNSHKVQRQIRDAYKTSCHECEIEVSEITLALPPRALIRDWKIDFRPEIPRGAFSMAVHYNNDKGVTQTLWANGKISIFRVVPVATRNLNAGERIQPNDLIRQRRDITFSIDNIPETTELLGAVVARSVMASQVIWKNSLQRIKALNRGDVVKLVSGSEQWQITISGVAQQSGFIGDMVQVENSGSHKSLSGVIVDKGVVRIQ
jgi:flagella basal body P-ring formation protein FlgA